MTTMLPHLFPILLFIAIDVKSQWSFAVRQADDGSFIPYWKDKEIGYSFGEDSFVTTPSGIAVADGVGGSKFASLHIARHLTTSFAQWVFACKHLEEPLRSKSPLCKIKTHKDDSVTIREVMRQVMLKNIKESEEISARIRVDKKLSASQASTFVSAYFSPENLAIKKKATLNIFQKGDSLALILRYDEASRNWKPFAYTSDDQVYFNAPYQYSPMDFRPPFDRRVDRENRFFSIEPREKDVVILGSDGLFDNLPVSMITLIFNTVVRFYSKKPTDNLFDLMNPSPKIPIKSLLKAYQRLLSQLSPDMMLETDKEEANVAEYDSEDFAENWEEKQKLKEQTQQQNGNFQESLMKKSVVPNQNSKKSQIINKGKSNPLTSSVVTDSDGSVLTPDQIKSIKASNDKQVKDDGLTLNIELSISKLHEKGNGAFSVKVSKILSNKEIDESDLTNKDSRQDFSNSEILVDGSSLLGDKSNVEIFRQSRPQNQDNFLEAEKNILDGPMEMKKLLFTKSLEKANLDSTKTGARTSTEFPLVGSLDNQKESQAKVQQQVDFDILKIAKSIIIEPKRCKIKNLFFHKNTEKNHKNWGFEGLLDFCFEEVLNKMFSFGDEVANNIAKFFNAKFFSASLSEFVKELTIEPTIFPSPFWVHYVEDKLKNKHKNNQSWKRPSFFTKSDDITVVAALVVKKDTTQAEIDKAVKREKAIADRINFLEKRNKFELEQDLRHQSTYNL